MENLVGDSSGSVVVQKLLDICTPDHRRAIMEKLQQSVVQLSLHMHGCRVIQKAFQVCPPNTQIVLAGELRHGVLDCIQSVHGNLVVQAWMPPEFCGFVVEAVEEKVEHMVDYIYGCRIIQSLLEHCAPKVWRRCCRISCAASRTWPRIPMEMKCFGTFWSKEIPTTRGESCMKCVHRPASGGRTRGAAQWSRSAVRL